MTRKDYKAVAEVLRQAERQDVGSTKPMLATKIVADVLGKAFHNFDRVKFLKAVETGR